ncbi:MAG TPA: hypothetical protein VLX59_03825, partial [Acidimicrobiales bacterium]|nr:hypothetical protein [Acidimicrobiales bacterium]
MIVSERDQPGAGSRRVLILYVVAPLVVGAAAVVVIAGSPYSTLDAFAVLLAIASAIWWLVRVRRFFTYRKRLAASSDSFPATVVAAPSRSVVRRSLWRRYLTLDAPHNDDLPNIKVALLFAQTVPPLEGDQTVRVRGPERGSGPLVVVSSTDGSVLLGSGSRFDASQPSGLRLVWLAFLEAGRAIGRPVRRGFRAIPNTPRALARAVSSVARWLTRVLTVAIALLATSIAGVPHAIVVAATVIGRAVAAAGRATIRGLRAGARGTTRAL